jgi:hypothetical protein
MNFIDMNAYNTIPIVNIEINTSNFKKNIKINEFSIEKIDSIFKFSFDFILPSDFFEWDMLCCMPNYEYMIQNIMYLKIGDLVLTKIITILNDVIFNELLIKIKYSDAQYIPQPIKGYCEFFFDKQSIQNNQNSKSIIAKKLIESF